MNYSETYSAEASSALNSDGLHPCPFCGRSDVLSIQNAGDCFWIGCGSCESEGPYADTPDDAVDRWNRRPASSPQTTATQPTPETPDQEVEAVAVSRARA